MTRPSPMLTLAVLALFVLTSLIPVSAAVAAQTDSNSDDPAAMVEDVKAAFEKAEHQQVLRQVGRVLALKGRAAEGVDRYEMLMIKAESHLRLKAQTAAIKSLEEAAAIAPDDKSASQARALVMLIKRSRGLMYTPKVRVRPATRPAGKEGKDGKDAKDGKGAGGGVIDLNDMSRRQEAFESLYAEHKASAQPKVKTADKSKRLPEIAKALQAVVPLRDLEFAATGSDVETSDTVKDLVDRAQKLMANALDDMTRRTERIATRANELQQYTTTRFDGLTETRVRRRGLSNEDARELKAIVEDCQRIFASCKELAEGFTDDDEPFEDLQEQARDTGERADEVRKDNYSAVRS